MKNSVLAVIIVVCVLAIVVAIIATRPKMLNPTTALDQTAAPAQVSGGDKFLGEWVEIKYGDQEYKISNSDTRYKYIIVYSLPLRENPPRSETLSGVYNGGILELGGGTTLHINSDGNLVEQCGYMTTIYRRK